MGEDRNEGRTITEVIEEGRLSEDEPELEFIDEEPSPAEEVQAMLNIGEGVDPLEAVLGSDGLQIIDKVFIRRLKSWFEIVAIADSEEYEELVKRCTHEKRTRRGGARKELDSLRLARLTVVNYTLQPAFHPRRSTEGFAQLADKYKTTEPETIVQRALLIGEIDMLSEAILTLSGFDDEVETAGN